jgi:hypothetical protein
MDVNPDGAGARKIGLQGKREAGAVLHGLDLR